MHLNLIPNSNYCVFTTVESRSRKALLLLSEISPNPLHLNDVCSLKVFFNDRRIDVSLHCYTMYFLDDVIGECETAVSARRNLIACLPSLQQTSYHLARVDLQKPEVIQIRKTKWSLEHFKSSFFSSAFLFILSA